ncbi:hypothetical protein ABIA33_007096 [Streptacidiphilus sp. MAP12-16]|uniref:hypothetical protein n=1 Tax=Streptacidiphilus sp. MAP12-16 TaxID=3156300 RepID=UPI003514FEC3
MNTRRLRAHPWRWGSVLLVTALFLAVGAFIAVRIVNTVLGPSRELDPFHVAGYQRIAVRDGSYPGTKTAIGTYLGPGVQGNPSSLVSGPGLEFTHFGTPVGVNPLPTDAFLTVAMGKVSGTNCGLLVDEFRRTSGADPGWGLSAEQARKLRSGSLEIIQLDVVCGSG